MVYLFADCVLDLEQRQLRRGAAPVPLQPQVLDLLVYLIENRHRVVSKAELVERVWGGRIVSDSTLDSRISAVRKAVDDTGKAQRLVQTLPRKGARFVGAVTEQADAAGPRAAAPQRSAGEPLEYPPPNRPSIAVLPFDHLSDARDEDYFTDGIVEEIITELSRNPSLFVIARNSSFVYKGRSVDIKRVGRELGVRYVLEGGVRKAGERVRISGQLIDALTGAHLWAYRFDGLLDDIFELQDEVAARVIGAIEPQLHDAEIRRAWGKPTASLDAYDHVLRAVAELSSFHVPEALALCRKAIAIDPRYAVAYGMAAQCIALRKSLRLGAAPVGRDEEEEGEAFADLAVEFGADHPTALWMAGQALLLLRRRYDRALELTERALSICPNSAPVLNASGWTRWSVGDGDVSIDRFHRATRLSPVDPYGFLFRSGIGWAHFVQGRYEDALEWAEKALNLQPHCVASLRCKVAACGLLGRTEEAGEALRALLGLQPEETLTGLERAFPLKRPRDMAAFLRGLRQAGLPE